VGAGGGYRHIDTAQAYRNEASVGRALRDSGLPREEVFIATKLDPVRDDPEAEIRAAWSASASSGSIWTSPLAAGRPDLGLGRDAARAEQPGTRARSAADFKPCGYDFRPGFRVQDAIAEVHFRQCCLRAKDRAGRSG
jgi:hypothetical protein